MRNHPVRVLALLILPLSAAGVQAAAESVRLSLAPEHTLRAGAHAAIEVFVELPPGNDSPLLLTPSLEGGALEVVRGRLTRPDGKPVDGAPTRLRFEIPVWARSEGTAILNVDLMTYVCKRTCDRVTVRRSQVVRVRP